jgi:hypothetical protein
MDSNTGMIRLLQAHEKRLDRLGAAIIPPLAATVPIGGIICVPSGMSIPNRWLACNGAAVNGTLYPTLHSICATLPNPTAPTGCAWVIRAA